MPQTQTAAAVSSTSVDNAVALNFIMLDRNIITGGSERVKVLQAWFQGGVVWDLEDAALDGSYTQ